MWTCTQRHAAVSGSHQLLSFDRWPEHRVVMLRSLESSIIAAAIERLVSDSFDVTGGCGLDDCTGFLSCLFVSARQPPLLRCQRKT